MATICISLKLLSLVPRPHRILNRSMTSSSVAPDSIQPCIFCSKAIFTAALGTLAVIDPSALPEKLCVNNNNIIISKTNYIQRGVIIAINFSNFILEYFTLALLWIWITDKERVFPFVRSVFHSPSVVNP